MLKKIKIELCLTSHQGTPVAQVTLHCSWTASAKPGLLCLKQFMFCQEVFLCIINAYIKQDVDDFNTAFTSMMEFVNNPDNWAKMEEELKGRGVGVC